MRLISARYDDVCLTCFKKIYTGDLIYWDSKVSYHEKCHKVEGVKARWLQQLG